MRVLKWSLLLLCLTTAAAGRAADATLALDFYSAYVWRGITLNDGLVFAPSVDIANIGDFTLNVWGNMDLDDYNGALESGEFSENDITLSYAVPVKGFDLTLGYIEYLFPNGGESTSEVFVSSGFDTGVISIGVDGYYDFDQVDDYYAKLTLSRGFPITNRFSLDLSADAGFAGDKMAVGGESGFHDYNIGLAGAIALAPRATLTLTAAYAGSGDEDVLPDQEVDFYGGVGLSYSF